MAAPPTAANVAAQLADAATRLATLDALEQHNDPHSAELATAAAPALAELLALDAVEVPHAAFQRVGLLRGRLLDDQPALFGAMMGGKHTLCDIF